MVFIIGWFAPVGELLIERKLLHNDRVGTRSPEPQPDATLRWHNVQMSPIDRL